MNWYSRKKERGRQRKPWGERELSRGLGISNGLQQKLAQDSSHRTEGAAPSCICCPCILKVAMGKPWRHTMQNRLCQGLWAGSWITVCITRSSGITVKCQTCQLGPQGQEIDQLHPTCSTNKVCCSRLLLRNNSQLKNVVLACQVLIVQCLLLCQVLIVQCFLLFQVLIVQCPLPFHVAIMEVCLQPHVITVAFVKPVSTGRFLTLVIVIVEVLPYRLWALCMPHPIRLSFDFLSQQHSSAKLPSFGRYSFLT